MVFPTHNRLNVRGIFDGTPEIWSYGMHFPSVVTAGPDVQPGDWNESAVTAALAAFHSSSILSSKTRLTGWRGYQIGPDGRTIGNNLKVVELDPGTVGAGTHRYPPQVTTVVSFVAGNRGPAKFGRCYLPGPAGSINITDSRMTAGDAMTVATTFKTLVEALLNAMYTDVLHVGEELVNVSRSGEGVFQTVETVRVGRVFDTMRSRRNKLVEDYQEVSLL
jgi:hypothetical protein